MCLLAMNWKQSPPPTNFVGFAIEYQEPGGTQYFALNNRIAFANATGTVNITAALSSRSSPFQTFRWIHFPWHADIPGSFTYRVTPVFMDSAGVLSYGPFQEAGIELEADTYPGQLNICFTRGFISSQAFVDNFGTNGGVGTIIPQNDSSTFKGIDFTPTAPNAETALSWMGFEARAAILNSLDLSTADKTAQVYVAAFDLNDMEIISRLQQLNDRLKIIIDDSKDHKAPTDSESRAEALLAVSAGRQNVKRGHMGALQHNKTITVDGNDTKIAIAGSTNLSWRGLYIQNNNVVALQGASVVKIFKDAFNNLWQNPSSTATFKNTTSAEWNDLGLSNINAQITFSPHSTTNAKLQGIADDISSTESSLFYSLAFLSITGGSIPAAIKAVTQKDDIFVYGLADKSVGGLELQLPNGNPPVAFPGALADAPPPFKDESVGGGGIRIHHKFVVIDFNKPTARVYTGSHNFSNPADTKNGENLLIIRDQRVATSYMIEAVAMFDHYEFRDAAKKSAKSNKPLILQKPPAAGSNVKPWWDKYWTDVTKRRDRELFGV